MAINPIVVPISFQVDNADLESQIAEAQARVLKAFNKSGGALSGAKAQSFNDVEYYLNNATPTQLGSIKGNNPQLSRELGSYNRFASSGKTDQDRQNDARDQKNATRDQRNAAREQQQAQREQSQQQRNIAREQLRALQAQNSQQRSATNTLSRGMAVGGAFATGNLGPLQRALSSWAMGSLSQIMTQAIFGSRGILTTATSTSASTGGAASGPASGTSGAPGQMASATQQIASTTGQAIANQLQQSTQNTSGPGAPGPDAEEEKSVQQAKEMGPLMKVLTGLGPEGAAFGAGLGVLSSAALTANAATAWSAAMRRQQYDLIANVAGSGGGQYAEKSVLDQSKGYLVNSDVVAQVYQALGNQGVQGIGNVSRNAANALALSNITGIGIGEATQTTGTLSAQGGLSADDIGSVYESVIKGSKSLNISMTGLLDTLNSFTKATNGASLSVKGAQSLFSLQGLVGTSVNVGSAVAPLANASGTQALMLQNMLGLSGDQLDAMQKSDPAGLAAQYGAFLHSQTAGAGDTGTQMHMMEAINQQVGGFALSDLSPENQEKFLKVVASGGSQQQISDAFSKFHTAVGPGSAQLAKSFRDAGVTVGSEVISAADKAEINLQDQANIYLDAILGNTSTMKDNSTILNTNFDTLTNDIVSVVDLLSKIGNIPNPLNHFKSDSAAGTVGGIAGWIEGAIPGGLLGGPLGSIVGSLLGSAGGSAVGNLLTKILGPSISGVAGAVGSTASGFTGAAESIFGDATSLFGGSVSAGGIDPSGSITGPAGIKPFDVYKQAGYNNPNLASTPVKPTADQMKLFQAAANKYHVPIALLLAQAATESGFDPTAGQGKPGAAMGLGQFTPGTWNYEASLANSPVYGTAAAAASSGAAYDAATNVAMMGFYDSQLFASKGNWAGVIAAYGDQTPGYNTAVDTSYKQAQQQVNIQVTDATQNGVNVSTSAPPVNHSRTPVGSRSHQPKHPLSPPKPTAPAKKNAGRTPTRTSHGGEGGGKQFG